MCGQRSAFCITPQRVAPQSPIQVTSEGTSSRTSGPCSAFQSVKDCDRLKFRPGKLTKWTPQCHLTAPGACVPSTVP